MSITPQVAMMLAQAFKGLGKKETAENLKQGFGSLASQAGQQGLDKMIEFMNVAEAKAPALSVLTATIQSETTAARMELMKSTLELLDRPNVQAALGYLTEFINAILQAAAWLLDNIPTSDAIAEAGAGASPEIGEDGSGFWQWFAEQWARATAERSTSGGTGF